MLLVGSMFGLCLLILIKGTGALGYLSMETWSNINCEWGVISIGQAIA
jgi:hypothetical protein